MVIFWSSFNSLLYICHIVICIAAEAGSFKLFCPDNDWKNEYEENYENLQVGRKYYMKNYLTRFSLFFRKQMQL
jgi:hypothetical protein